MKRFNGDFCYPDVIQLIMNIEFPSLREIRFETITTRVEALHRFLLRTNVKHIKVLSILSPAIPDRWWSYLRVLLEEAMPPYEYLELSDAYSYGSKTQGEQDYLYKCVLKYVPPGKKCDCDYRDFPLSNPPLAIEGRNIAKHQSTTTTKRSTRRQVSINDHYLKGGTNRISTKSSAKSEQNAEFLPSIRGQ